VLRRKQPILVKKTNNYGNDINNVQVTKYEKNREFTNIFVVRIVVNLLRIFTEEINNTQFWFRKLVCCVTAFQIRLTFIKNAHVHDCATFVSYWHI